MPDYTGTSGNDLFDFNNLFNGDVFDGLGGQDTIDGSSLNNNYLFDFSNEVIATTDGNFVGTMLNFEEGIGGNGNDIMIGGTDAVAYNLDGGAGNDTISPGSAGIFNGEEYIGGSGTDVLDFSNLTTDFVIDMNAGSFNTGSFTATISGFEEIFAGSGNDFIREQTGVQSTLHGGLGNDTLATAGSGVAGGEIFDGGAGTDRFDFTNQSVSYIADLLNGVFSTINGGFATTLTSIEEASAGSGNDSLVAGDNVNAVYSLFGNGGNDTILARVGELVSGEVYDGGEGIDTFNFSGFTADYRLNTEIGTFRNANGSATGTAANFEIVLAGTGSDLIGGNNTDQRLEGNAGNDTIFGGEGTDTILGGSGQDVLRGDDGADSMDGGAGNDHMIGGDGADTLLGQAGNDTLIGADGADFLNGGDDNDLIAGDAGNDTAVGGLGNDTILGGSGFDSLSGGAGDDLIDGGAQADNLFGENGNDTLLGGAGFDRLFGGNGNDLAYGGSAGDGVFGEAGNDTLFGQAGNDRFFGGSGNDMIDGGADNDTIYAGAGFDTIVGSTGNDELWGLFNADVFIFADFGGGFGQDTIADFAATNVFERIDLSRVASITNLSDLLNNHTNQVGSNVLIDAGGGNTITLLNVNLGDLDATDFIF
ncbi:hypothetical protein A8B82_10885 [Sulfitobacter sp. EhC04]|uniref:calcium-binding protein n=1 Tax=Sulfitobacter sp. EhC04 TaxID=1849168 RepID=UPI0007F4210A|nr:calcium-binding protein [Sulfitobacter sp. EhC04]OAN78234.1 hypothetical protein A8B82_10885 [Sulfitobacter sp. EhC04]